MSMSMDQLSDLSLLKIFGFFDGLREKIKLERVCRRWHNIMLKDGWKHIRQIQLRNLLWIEPLGVRCGQLVECLFFEVDIDSTSIHLIGQHFPALKHLDFNRCKLKELDADALELFRKLGTRLRSLNFYFSEGVYQLNDQLSHNSLRLQNLGLDISRPNDVSSLPSRLPTGLRSLHMSCRSEFSLHFLRINMDFYFAYFNELLYSCLENMPQLLALHLDLSRRTQHLPTVFISPIFRDLVHLSLILHKFANFESIGQLATIAKQLRSLSVHLPVGVYKMEISQVIGCKVLKIAHNGTLEYLDVPCASFTLGMLIQLIRICPNLHSFGARLWQDQQVPQIVEMRHIVMGQWQAGKRKHLPLRIWLYDHSQFSWRDSFLDLHIVQSKFVPPNPVLDALFREEVFTDGGGTPSFMTEHFSSMTG